MKQVILLLLMALYLISSNGIQVELHYCMGRLKTVSFFDFEQEDCGCKKDWACCDYTSIAAKLSTEHQVNGELSLEVKENVKNPAPRIASIQKRSSGKINFFGLDDYPPPKALPLFLLNSSLIFYG